VVIQIYHPSCPWRLLVSKEDHVIGEKNLRPYLKKKKKPKAKRIGDMAQKVELLPPKCEALSSNPSPPKISIINQC
jgi:hypothetical protein